MEYKKTAETIDDLIGNKIANEIMKNLKEIKK